MSCAPAIAIGQGIQTEFGKNRTQYKKFEWVQYESENFIAYWYEDSNQLGEFVLQIAERDNLELQTILEYRVNDKIQILLYNDLNDLKQSNLGNEETFFNTGGITRIIGNKVFIHFDGNRQNLRKHVREGISHVYLNRMMFGGNLQEIVQNAVLLNLPQWFTNGLVAYVGEDWNTEKDNILRDGFLSGKYESFLDVINDDSQLAGHSLWYYIGQNYGQSTVANLLYLTRINRSVESGFLYVLGNTYKQATESWFDFFQQRYLNDQQIGQSPQGNPLETENLGNKRLSQVKLNASGNRVAYVQNDYGKFKVMVQELKRTPEIKVVLKDGLKNTLQEPESIYPLLDWSTKGNKLTILYESRNQFKVVTYNASSGKTESNSFDKEFSRITSLSSSGAGKLIVSAIKNGQSDIFTMDVTGDNVRRITNDAYDDFSPAVVNVRGRQGIVFASNRNSNELQAGNPRGSDIPGTFDLYFLSNEGGNKQIIRLTDTPLANEKYPIQLDSSYFGYLSDENGIYNRYSSYVEEVVSHYNRVIVSKSGEQIRIHQDSTAQIPDSEIDTTYLEAVYVLKPFPHANSNLSTNLLEFDVASAKNKMSELYYINGKYHIYIKELTASRNLKLSNSGYRNLVVNSIEELPASGPTVPINNVLDSIPLWQLPDELEKELPEIENPVKDDNEEGNLEDPAEVVIENTEEEGTIDIDNYFFQSEFDDNETPAAVIVEDENGNITLQSPSSVFRAFREPEFEAINFNPSDVIPSKRKFKLEYLSTQLDNSFLFDGRENNKFSPPLYEYPGVGIMLKGSIKDIHEDYRFQGGFRIPITFDGVEYFITFDDKKKRLDKRYGYYRKSHVINEDAGNFNAVSTRTITNIAETRFSFPLDIYSSIRSKIFLRTDRNIVLATDQSTLEQPRSDEERIGLQVEYVYDNTVDISVNIKHGTRFKVFGEVQKQFDLKLFEPETNFDFSFNDGFLHVLGFDVRHYLKIDKYSILAGRAAFATSFGAQKNLYFLGGQDGWILPEALEEIPVPDPEGFAYQALASQMRGFKNNIRNGNSYAVLNFEGRFPIFNYFGNHPLKSSFLRNFQIVGFLDIGTAWQGVSPFQENNPLNTVEVGDPNSPVSVEVNYFRNPIVYGFGGGIRSLIFGYFVKLDYAWGFETGVLQEPVFYISLGKDF